MREYSARMEHMMYTPVTLPVTNEYGYFEIRLESIGGLGANLCGKMLGELGALYLSLNSLSFSSYGSEKRGSPVKSYIRWSPASHPLRINSPVLQPHVLGIFHEGLIGTSPVLDGISADTKIVLNTPLSCDEAAEKYNIPTTLLCDTNHVLYSDYSDVIIVGAGADAVDYKLISICHKGDVVVSQDYGVAAMALGKGAYAIHQSGKWYTNENIDQMLMERHLNKKARRSSHKNHIKGPRKRTEDDDVRFAQSFEKLILMAKSKEGAQDYLRKR